MDDPLTPEQEKDALAAELALGLLAGEERAAALRLQLSDTAFAEQVRGWEARLSPLHGQWAEVAPDPAVWSGIAARLGEPAAAAPVTDIRARLNRWRTGALMTGAVAAALALTLVMRPVEKPVTPAAATQMAMAHMSGEAGGPVVVARYDPQSAELKLRISGVKDGALAPELWIIPEGGKPVSLGMIARSGSASMTMPAAQRGMMAEGATMAVTMEPNDGAPHAAPSSAPVAAGKISLI